MSVTSVLSMQYGQREIVFSLERAMRKTLKIAVTPQMAVQVVAPVWAPQELIEKKVKKRASWICKQLDFFKSLPLRPSIRRYVSWETYVYLWRTYILSVTINKNSGESVKLKGRNIEVICRQKQSAEVLLEKWFAQRARQRIVSYAQPLIAKFSRLHNKAPTSLSFRKMRTRWGSCTSKWKVTLNTQLIHAPVGCIEYVILHELCHLVHRGHTKLFYTLQWQYLPNWKTWKERLDTQSEQYFT